MSLGLRDSQLVATIETARAQVNEHLAAVNMITASPEQYEAFLNAEFLLALLYGLRETAALRMLQHGMAIREAIQHDPLPDAGRILTALGAVNNELATTMSHPDSEHVSVRSRELIKRGALIVGGGFVIGLNTIIGGGSAPVTGGLSLAGATVSSALGGALMSKGFEAAADRGEREQFIPNLPPL